MTNEINTSITWVLCPYCGESFEALVDCSAGGMTYVEDCEVCCRPIECEISIDFTGKLVSFTARRDDE